MSRNHTLCSLISISGQGSYCLCMSFASVYDFYLVSLHTHVPWLIVVENCIIWELLPFQYIEGCLVLGLCTHKSHIKHALFRDL